MKALRIKLLQSQASYTREETVNNRMTYPLPPYSTIIGALHNACGYTEYHPMDISVQGKYGAMQQEIYVNHALLNRTEDDRGILIWLSNANSLNTGYITVAEALANNASFMKEELICVNNENLFNLYKSLKEKNHELESKRSKEIKPLKDAWKNEKKELKHSLKGLKKDSDEYNSINEVITNREEELNELIKKFEEQKYDEYTEPYSHFRTLTKGPQKQEVLYEVELIIHVCADEEVLQDIVNHKYDLVSLGRSEDFIELAEVEYCEVVNSVDSECVLPKGYSMYVNIDRVCEEQYNQYFEQDNMGNQSKVDSDGTVYYVAKRYVKQNGYREFDRIPCLYSSSFTIDEESENILFDKSGGYLVDFN